MFVDAMKKGHGIAWELAYLLVCSKFFLKRHFGGQNKLLKLASRKVNYGALNGPIIAHVLTKKRVVLFDNLRV